MGLLEDAIREHLDLKRKHGAPEQELERQEVEALGPARRETSPPADSAEHPPGGDADVAAAEADALPEDAAVAAEEPPIDEHPAVDVEPPPAVAPVDEHEVESPVEEPPVDEHHALEAAEPLPGDPAGVEADEDDVGEPVPGVDQPTELFDVDEALAGDTPQRGFPAQDEAPEDDAPEDDAYVDEDEDEDGDVLEDTPDFLQDAPEHDRLWFEQKPPRDFDFD